MAKKEQSSVTVFPGGMLPHHDERATRVRNLDQPHILRQYLTPQEWHTRAVQIRRHILAVTGLMPIPPASPLNAQLSRPIEREGYSVCNVYFESHPRFLVTGNLYRPTKGSGPFPAVLCPHGHWQHGRLEDSERCSVPGRCIGLARLGFVVFSYDMIGYNDSQQLDHRNSGIGAVDHLWGVSLGGLQLYNSIRALDFLESLEFVDRDRIGCTGASGGGTQTFLLMAVDERVKVAAPVAMVSAHFQGGCVCENPPGLRLNLNNVEIAACMAPRPLLLSSVTGDWTNHTPWIEFPYIRHIYSLFGATERVACVHFDAGHNYNKETREAVYAWFVRWLQDNPAVGQRIPEGPFSVEPAKSLRVFPVSGPPRSFPRGARLLSALRKRAQEIVKQDLPHAVSALREILPVRFPAKEELAVWLRGERKVGDITLRLFAARRREVCDGIPSVLAIPERRQENRPATLLIDPRGKGVFFSAETGKPLSLAKILLDLGHAVLTIDPFLIGESAALRKLTENIRNGVAHVDTYNPTIAAERVQDILTSVAVLKHYFEFAPIQLVGVKEAALWCLLARAFSPVVDRTLVDLGGLDVSNDKLWADLCYVPGLRRAGDLLSAATLIAPGELHIYGVGRRFPAADLRAIYRNANASAKLHITAARLAPKGLLI